MTDTDPPLMHPGDDTDNTQPIEKSDELQGLDPKNLIAKGLRSDSGRAATSAGGWQPPEVADLAELFPRFKIIKLLGRGGMGAVYQAKQTGLDRLVAIKVLPPQASEDAQFTERFSREAKALAMLNHPHIVAVHDFGEAAGMFYIVMEYVEGADLRQTLKAGKMTPAAALNIVPQVCDALQYAHSKGLVHRDIKPENILLESSGNVKIADFGLARLLGSEIPEWTLTATEQVMGTLKYMAPEQVEGAQGIDHRADIYSLGVVFYEMLTGELPIGRFASPSAKSTVDKRVDDVVFKTLEKEPADRYQDASSVKLDVENLSSEPPPVPGIDCPIDTPPDTPAVSPLESSTSVPLEVKSRLSMRAMIGAIWALLAIPSAILPILFITPMAAVSSANPVLPSAQWHSGSMLPVAQAQSVSIGYNYGMIFIALIVLVIGFSSVIGTPIMGRLAIRDIHHSNGKLFGLRLALADLLVFPLLFVDLLMVLLFFFFAKFFVGYINGSISGIVPILLLVIGLALIAVVDFFMIRWAWRRYRLPADSAGASHS